MEKVGLKKGIKESMRKAGEQGKSFEQWLRSSVNEDFGPEVEDEKLIRVGRVAMGCWMETEMTEEQLYDKYDKGWRRIDD